MSMEKQMTKNSHQVKGEKHIFTDEIEAVVTFDHPSSVLFHPLTQPHQGFSPSFKRDILY